MSAWLRASAEDLAGRFQRREVARSERQRLRKLLGKAFDCLDSGQIDLTLFRAVDTAAVGTLPSPLPPPFQGAFRELGAIDLVLVDRIFGYEGIYARSTKRIEKFLAATGGDTIALKQRQVVGRYEEEGMTFTKS